MLARLVASVSTVVSLLVPAAAQGEPPAPARAEVGRALREAIDGERPARASLVGFAQKAADDLPVASLMRARLLTLVDAAKGQPSIPGAADGAASPALDDATLRARLRRLADDLQFEPLREAPVPEGWPAPAPVGDAVIKQYPAYRMAQAPMRSAGDMSAFWKLFRHIQSNDIPMTAPVQMDHTEIASRRATSPERTDDVASERVAMAFLYETTARGTAGPQGDVAVVDVPAARWVAIGARGYESEDDVADMQEALKRWLAAHAPQFEVTGPMRLMGWNSPSVRGDKRFYEVELPIRVRRDA